MNYFKSLATSFLFLLPFFLQAEMIVPKEYNQRLTRIEKTLAKGYNVPGQLSSGYFLQGDIFYWSAKEAGLDYALVVDNTEVDIATPLHYKIMQPQFDWDFGFRGAIGYNFHDSQWDLGLYWTHLLTHAKDRGPIKSSYGIIPVFANPNFISENLTGNDANANFTLFYNQLDLTLGYRFYVGKAFVLRPFIGPTALVIDQHYTLKYERTATIEGVSHVKMKNNFEGIGLNAGCDLRFLLKHGWSIYGKAEGGLYYGFFSIKRKEKFTDLTGDVYRSNAKHPLHLGAPTAALAIGFVWERGFCHHRYSASFKLLWEQLIFFGQNQFFRFVSTNSNVFKSNELSNQGDLTLQGGTLSFSLGF